MKRVLRAIPRWFYHETTFQVALGRYWLKTVFHEIHGRKARTRKLWEFISHSDGTRANYGLTTNLLGFRHFLLKTVFRAKNSLYLDKNVSWVILRHSGGYGLPFLLWNSFHTVLGRNIHFKIFWDTPFFKTGFTWFWGLKRTAGFSRLFKTRTRASSSLLGF